MSSRRQHTLPKPGTLAPGFRLTRLEGGTATLAELTANGPALLVFFKITCPVCQMAMPYLDRIYRQGTLPVWGISQNGAADTREFATEFGASFPMLLDSEDEGFPASNEYGLASVPTLFLVEAGGKLSRAIEGWSRQEMEDLGKLAGFTLFRAGDNVPAWKAG